ncbi:helix-turn-helix transcriptional regulator [Sporolactobacillus laevolacticus]|jgi:transcriptional regulator with XRE-family HTH domain|uniref:XRE family transcriptional regulator n=1 Tax=Sporolactobacillus laevolacticus DSM 442 TaxID=1395513 RepID=V6IV87_9BACL|nr:helix-turn-helix transcriptional regulator [Sporolactobacillus laevolacticus]EST10381.1 XRE family transcriptional regulator [Sporolactobacillus laevolacticus DSM 442]MDF2910143.1 family transcriptional regulator [Sporolactobacillus laevolacticus]MDN3956900.1 helix-turn-helix transcriptional regulator [Sporolactobacillus laevolacticus]
MEKEQWGRKIRAFRKLKGFTQAELAKELGISLTLLGEIERESRDPENDLVLKICDTLGVSLQEMQEL